MGRGYSIDLREGLTRIVVPSKFRNKDQKVLSSLVDGVVTPSGVKSIENNGTEVIFTIGNDIFENAGDEYPWPQVVITPYRRFFLSDSLFAYKDHQYGNGQFYIYDTGEPATEVIFPDNQKIWSVADFGMSFFMAHPDHVVISPFYGRAHTTPFADYNIGLEDIGINAACNHRGRLLLGGFQANPYYISSEWVDFFASYYGTSQNDPQLVGAGSMYSHMEDNFVWWSPIGADPYMLFYPQLGRFDAARMLEIFRMNQVGCMAMPGGAVLDIREFGSDVLVYCERGVYRMFPISSPYPGYGYNRIYPFGLKARGLVTGDENIHVFVDSLYRVVKISSSGVTILGNEGTVDFEGASYFTSYYDPLRDTAYFLSEDNDLRWIASPGGVSQLKTVWEDNSAIFRKSTVDTVNLWTRKTRASTETISMTFNPLIFKTKGFKTVFQIDLEGTFNADFSATGTLNSQSLIFNSSGIANCWLEAEEFTLSLDITDSLPFEIENVRVHWQYTDSRDRRSIDVG